LQLGPPPEPVVRLEPSPKWSGLKDILEGIADEREAAVDSKDIKPSEAERHAARIFTRTSSFPSRFVSLCTFSPFSPFLFFIFLFVAIICMWLHLLLLSLLLYAVRDGVGGEGMVLVVKGWFLW
jgi:hypothetical protein